MTNQSDLISGTVATSLLGFKNRSSLTRLVQSGAIAPKLKGSGLTGEQFFDRTEVDALAEQRASSRAGASGVPSTDASEPNREDVPGAQRHPQDARTGDTFDGEAQP